MYSFVMIFMHFILVVKSFCFFKKKKREINIYFLFMMWINNQSLVFSHKPVHSMDFHPFLPLLSMDFNINQGVSIDFFISPLLSPYSRKDFNINQGCVHRFSSISPTFISIFQERLQHECLGCLCGST